ncbi:MAG: Rrf2 family transcriptional regulator, partial [Gemmatimonadetes bacterium]|nr:Rrf2 family transcriptional regulator [Gemmatimonadota bacterium]
MHLTRGSEYALRGLTVLASHPRGEAVSLADIAATQSTPAAYLAKVFQRLVRYGLLVAAPGRGHGYALARAP